MAWIWVSWHLPCSRLHHSKPFPSPSSSGLPLDGNYVGRVHGEFMGPTSPHSTEETILAALKKGQSSCFVGLANGVDGEELLSLLESLRADEEAHRARLICWLYGMEAEGPVPDAQPPAWPRSSDRTIPAAPLPYRL
jgi:hypothetical protein